MVGAQVYFKGYQTVSLFLIFLSQGVYAEALTPIPETEPSRFQTDAAYESDVEAPVDYRWRGGLHYFQGTTSDLGEVITGTGAMIAPNGVRASLGYVFAKELWGLPIEFLGEGGLMWHNEQDTQDDVWQSTLAIKLAWTEFPWDEHLRTRLAVAEGLSYVSHIPYTEKRNRGSDSSRHLLNYLELSVSFNCGDLYDLLPFDDSSDDLQRAWLVLSVPHRSGIWGVFGRDKNGDVIKGASNYVALGVEYEF